MRWDSFFEDLENQMASQMEAERGDQDLESERLRLSRLALRERLALMRQTNTHIDVFFSEHRALSGQVRATGSGWFALSLFDRRTALINLDAVTSLSTTHDNLLKSTAAEEPERNTLLERMTFAFALSSLARARIPVLITVNGGVSWSGTIDRVGADHCDLAIHEQGTPRRPDSVSNYQVVRLDALNWVRTEPFADTFV